MLKADDTNVQVRARMSTKKDAGLVIAINTTPKFVQAVVHVEPGTGELTAQFEARKATPSSKGDFTERFSPYGVHVYTWGPEPRVELARERR